MAKIRKRNDVENIINNFSSLNVNRENLSEIHKDIFVSVDVIEALELIANASNISIGLVIEKLVNDSDFIKYIDEIKRKTSALKNSNTELKESNTEPKESANLSSVNDIDTTNDKGTKQWN